MADSSDDVAKSDKDQLKEDRERWSFIKEHDFEKSWRKSSLTNLKYFTGEDQGWDEEGDRAALEAEKRPAITLNRIHPIMRLIQGARPKATTTFLPTGETGNIEIASILNSCNDHIDDINQWSFLEDEFFNKGIILDRSVVWLLPNYEMDIRGEVELSLDDGWNVYLDPDSTRKDRKDALDVFNVRQVFSDWAIRKWPKKEKQILRLKSLVEDEATGKMAHDIDPSDRYKDPPNAYFDSDTKKVSLVYRWYKTFEKSTKLIDVATGQIYDSPLTIDKARKALQEINIDNRYRVVERDYTRVHYKIFAHDILFEEGITPWERGDGQRTDLSDNLPCVIFEPDRFVFGTKQDLIQIISMFKDPSKYHNKLASSILSIINSTAKTGYDIEDGAISETELKKLREEGSKPGQITVWNKGALTQNMMQKKRPDVTPQAEIVMADKMASWILDISGVESLSNVKSLGKSASGEAIGLKQQQGGTVIDWIYSSFSFFRQQLASYKRDAAQSMYDYEKVIWITGPKNRKIILNQRVYDYQGVVEKVLNDVRVGKYAAKIREKPDFPSLRIERFKYFSEMVKSGAIALPPEVINKIVMELMDDPDLKEVVEASLAEWQQAQQQAMMQQAGMGGGGGPMQLPGGGQLSAST